jgi:putative sigma-54 modulation protein
MQINLQAKNLEITPAIHDYVVKKITDLGRILTQMEESGEEARVLFDIGRNTKHKEGEIFHADCLVKIKGKKFYASADKEDLYEAIDTIKESLFNEISKNKDKKISLFYRGARKMKNVLKGLTRWKK